MSDVDRVLGGLQEHARNSNERFNSLEKQLSELSAKVDSLEYYKAKMVGKSAALSAVFVVGCEVGFKFIEKMFP